MGYGGRPSGRRWERFTQLVFAAYGRDCHICGHGGARQVDHLVAVCDNPALAWELTNCRPSHGGRENPCPVCGRRCNQMRGARSLTYARQQAARPARGLPAGQARAEPGREW